ncbi:MAG: EAL domain-containing protein [Spirochaetia bacterium]|nr:EAL domain-containing protein [Spirochaetia bacterium]
MLRYFDEPYLHNAQYLHIKMVCGASFYPSTCQSPIELLRCSALAASMLDTQTKPQRTVFYSEDILRLYQRQDSIRKAIPALFSSDQLALAFQAQLSVTSGKIIGCEALIRWNHPVLGPVRPDEFIPLLKDFGMLDKLGRFVITQAIKFLERNGARLRLLSPSFSLSINLSADELANAALIDLLGASLREHRIAENLLTVELTEFSAVESFQKANSVFDKLHAQGVSIAIDDFGTGFSSLSYLLELSSDKIKIDRSFIARYPDAESITIYKTVMLLAKELGATVVAEGVENQEQLDFLSSIGCDEYQGYYFSAAVDEKVFLKQIEQVNI